MSGPALDIAAAKLDGFTDEEIVAELVRDGMTDDGAREYLRAWLAGERPYVDAHPELDGESPSTEQAR